MLCLKVLLPNVKIIWSEILQRKYWHYVTVGKSLEKSRKRVNPAVKNLILRVGGYVIRHHNIRERAIKIYRFDGTHLSNVGINVYLNTFQRALESFLLSVSAHDFPPGEYA